MLPGRNYRRKTPHIGAGRIRTWWGCSCREAACQFLAVVLLFAHIICGGWETTSR